MYVRIWRRCYMLWNLHGFGPWGPFPWAPMGFTYTIWTTLNPLLLRMIPAKFDKNPNPNGYFLHRAPSPTCYPAPQGPIRATLGTAMNNVYSSPNKVSTHYIPWLFYFWIWRRCLKFAWFWPLGALSLAPHWGHMYYITNLNPQPLRMIPAKFGYNPTMRFSRSRWNSYFLHIGPLPNLVPPQGPIGATLGTAMNNFCSSPNKVSTLYITWLFSFWIWRRRCLKFAWFWPHILFEQVWIPFP